MYVSLSGFNYCADLIALVLDRTFGRMDAPCILLRPCVVSQTCAMNLIDSLTLSRLVIIATLTMYIATGIRIYKKGAGMRFFMSDSQHTTDHRESTVIDESAMDSVAVGKSIVVTTQIQYDIQQHEQDPQSESCEADNLSVSSYSSTKNLSRVGPRTETEHSTPDDLRVSFIARDAIRPTQDRKNAHLQADSGYKATAFATNQFQDFATLPARPTSAITHHRDAHPRKAVLNDAALAYLKVAFLMFVALFVVWVCINLHNCLETMY